MPRVVLLRLAAADVEASAEAAPLGAQDHHGRRRIGVRRPEGVDQLRAKLRVDRVQL